MNHIYYNGINAMMQDADAFQLIHHKQVPARANLTSNASNSCDCDQHRAAMGRALAAQSTQDAPPAFHEVMSTMAPPAYSRNARRSEELNTPSEQLPHIDAKPSAVVTTTETRNNNLPPVLLELCVGHKLAAKMTQKRMQRRAARLERVHDAWAALGLDTRTIVSTNGKLPPHFWDPPLCTAEEWTRRMNECF